LGLVAGMARYAVARQEFAGRARQGLGRSTGRQDQCSGSEQKSLS